MKISSIPKLVKTDYPKEMQDAIEQLSYTINPLIDALTSLANNNISIADNLSSVVKTVIVTVTADGTPTGTTGFNLGKSNVILGLQVKKAVNNTNEIIYPTGGVWISYTQSGSQIIVNNVKGLPAGNQFALTVQADFS